jgi:phospholipid/cholesterol/gamma-HCH transport system substrate-binding protein
MWRHIRSVPGLGKSAAVVTLALVAALVVGGVLASRTEFTPPWETRNVVWAEFSQAPAVNPRSTQIVTIAGVRVGKITDWKVTDHGTAALKLDLEPGHQIYDNARAVLRSVNQLNQMYVEISPGGPPSKTLPENGLIPASRTQRPIQADEVLQHLDQRTQLALTDLLAQSDAALARAPQQLPGGLNATANTLGKFRPVLDGLQTRRDQIKRLVTALAEISNAVGGDQGRVARLADATQQTLGVLTSNDDELRATLKQLPGLGEQLRHALTSTQDLTGQLDPTLTNLHRASGELPPALKRLNRTVSGARSTIDAAEPVVAKARPVVADLRPLVTDANSALDDALPVTDRLDSDSRVLVSYLNDLAGFVYNTSSVFGLKDAQGGFIRGHVVVALPDGGVLPDKDGYAPPPKESGLPPAGGASPLIPGLGSDSAPHGGN